MSNRCFQDRRNVPKGPMPCEGLRLINNSVNVYYYYSHFRSLFKYRGIITVTIMGGGDIASWIYKIWKVRVSFPATFIVVFQQQFSFTFRKLSYIPNVFCANIRSAYINSYSKSHSICFYTIRYKNIFSTTYASSSYHIFSFPIYLSNNLYINMSVSYFI